ncbi:hypothetical protein [Sinorhizobium meliloti]|uniref:hypothetical protein n=1 Tax=Rhizobium meliloti TaxID=382 RepID=UPI000FD7B4F6|nr:hypothetical protein [Sinorhizobium meliloti]RVO60617.1 hypothetical protein CN092_04620 [Sinorhizobium meliloti]
MWRSDATEEQDRTAMNASFHGADAALFRDVMGCPTSSNAMLALDPVQAGKGGAAQVFNGPRVTGLEQFDNSALDPAVTSAHKCFPCSDLELWQRLSCYFIRQSRARCRSRSIAS